MDFSLATRLCPWDFPGENTGEGSHFLLQGIFPIQGQNPGLLHWQAHSLPLSCQGRLCFAWTHIITCLGLLISLPQIWGQRAL